MQDVRVLIYATSLILITSSCLSRIFWPYLLEKIKLQYFSYGVFSSASKIAHLLAYFLILAFPKAKLFYFLGVLLVSIQLILFSTADITLVFLGMAFGAMSRAFREISGPSLLASSTVKLKATILSILRSLRTVIGVVTPLLAAPILLVVRDPAQAYRIPLLISLIAVLSTLPILKHEVRSTKSLQKVGFLQLMRNKKLLLISLILALDTPVWLMLAPFTLLIAVREAGFDPVTVSLFDSLIAATIVISGPVCSYLSDRLGKRIVFISASEIVGALYVLLLGASIIIGGYLLSINPLTFFLTITTALILLGTLYLLLLPSLVKRYKGIN